MSGISREPGLFPPEFTEKCSHRRRDGRYLIDRINHLHFENECLHLTFKHKKYKRSFTVQATVEPCIGDEILCRWTASSLRERNLEKYEFQHLVVKDERELLLASPHPIAMDSGEIVLQVPRACYSFISNRGGGTPCRKGLTVRLTQNSTLFQGQLLEFGTEFFSARLSCTPPQTFRWIDPESPVHLVVGDEAHVFFAGDCTILSQFRENGPGSRVFELAPLKGHVPRFPAKEFRSQRQRLVPAPDVIFKHPLTGREIMRKVEDISGSGLSVKESRRHCRLFPGLNIPRMQVAFPGGLTLSCAAQVVHARSGEDGEQGGNAVHSGLVFLDMGMEDQRKLLALLHRAEDENAYICGRVDLDELWSFLFSTGFLYPDKYRYVHNQKEKLKQTYRKLYTQSPSIARHFVYQADGVISGHMAMLRFYGDAWLIHHHAASSSRARSGIKVLGHISRYINAVHNQVSSRLQYVFCYYRPENRFPEKVFGGSTRHINDPKKTCLEDFTYFQRRREGNGPTRELPDGWLLEPSDNEDLHELSYFYEERSNGLLLDAFELRPDSVWDGDLEREYELAGFLRQRRLYSLKLSTELKAVVLLNLADFGLNLSDLTNCLHLFLLDTEGLDENILNTAVDALLERFGQPRMPVLAYPGDWADAVGYNGEKTYRLWIYDSDYIDEYFSYCRWILRYF